MGEKKIRILMTKIGLDSHDRGLLVVASALRDAGMEVILLPLHQTAAGIAQAAIQENVDIVGLSSLDDGHRVLAPRAVDELRARGGDQLVVLGGFIQPEDIPALKEKGIAEVFDSSSRLDDIVRSIKEMASRR